MSNTLAPEQAVTEDMESQALAIPFPFARRHGVLLADEADEQVTIGVRGPVSPQIIMELRRYFSRPLILQSLGEEVFEHTLQAQYESGSRESMEDMGDLDDSVDLNAIAQQLAEPEDLLDSEDDAPIIRLINAVLTEAIKSNASDIHIEPYENRLRVRFRVDGILREVLQPKRTLAPLLVSRIKVMAKLDIAEKRVPQDGRIALRIAGRAVDVRVSTLPSSYGERVVMRILDKQAGKLELKHLGMNAESVTSMEHLIAKPHGIILVTGPTGSGKTTTLYAALTQLNQTSRNILTVEDPIEYYLDGVGQTQVNTKVEMTFARGLRAILRQDPDVVMVGEIRDLETAQIAVQASLTGHLVLSTLHTNTAVGAVTRLRDMGVEPFLLSSSLVGVLAQRLVRRLCPECKTPYKADAADCEVLGVDVTQAPTLYHPQGCEECNHLGYSGRLGIYELVEVDDAMRQLIHDEAGEQALEAQARKQSSSIRHAGVELVIQGTTSMEEVLRVTQED